MSYRQLFSLQIKKFAIYRYTNELLAGCAGPLSIGFQTAFSLSSRYTDKKENQIFLIFREIQNGAVAKSYMTNGPLIYGEIFAHFLIY